VPADTLEVRVFVSGRAFESWLAKHHAKSPGIWLRIAKKASGVKSVSYPEALDVALCYGWIDGLKKGHDETWFIQRFTPRKARSGWSKINRDKVAALKKSGRMKPAGLAAVERAMKGGEWDAAYDSFRTITVPPDLQAALDREPKAKTFFATLDSQNRYAVLYRLHTAKKAETRARRLEKFVAMLRKGEKLHP
jgi:uncharacterized protein YdeI (YjbR/CyaY-like superfamily)